MLALLLPSKCLDLSLEAAEALVALVLPVTDSGHRADLRAMPGAAASVGVLGMEIERCSHADTRRFSCLSDEAPGPVT
jgi:hypothetical protein